MKKFLMLAVFVASGLAQASSIPEAVYKASDNLKASDVRTVILKTPGSNPCDGGYAIEVQVKEAARGGADGSVVYSWKTVKTVSSDAQGNVIDVCEE